MSNVERAVKCAIEGGYERKNGSFSLPMKLNDEFDIWEYDTNAIFLDALFWQSLIKGMGRDVWVKEHGKPLQGMLDWQEVWYSFIDALIEGQDAESFFSQLLKGRDLKDN